MTPRPPPGGEATYPPARPRLDELDLLRGGAILLVVFMHTYFSGWPNTPRWELVTVRVLHLFGHSAVPLFFFISAFLLAHDRSAGWSAFAARKVRRIYAPLIFWMLAALAYTVWQAGGLTHQSLRALALFNIAGQFYFVVVLLFFTVAFFAFRGWPQHRLRWLTLAAFAINLAAIAYYQRQEVTGDFATLAYRNPLIWSFPFTFGYWAGRARADLAWTDRYRWPALAGMAAILAVYLVRGERDGYYPVSYFGVEVFLFACCGLIAWPSLARTWLRGRTRSAAGPLRSLSRYSFAIYLVHMPFFVGWVTNRTVTGSALSGDYLKLMLSLYVAGFGSTILFLLAIERLWPQFSSEFLALDPPRTSALTLVRRGLARLRVARTQRPARLGRHTS